MKKRSFRLALTLTLILITLIVFGYYIDRHRNLLRQLGHTPPDVLVALLLLYFVWFGMLGIVLQVSLRICKKVLHLQENLLLNAYSTLVNFFVPGQGGVAVRGLYLKRTKNLRVRNYVFVSLLYYFCYAVVATFLLFVANRPWWQTLLALVIIGGACYLVIQLYRRKRHPALAELDLSIMTVGGVLLATCCQAVVQVAIFGLELHHVNSHIHLGQILTYTGAANFSLFVALTPGAIGIRESFLLFSRRLHHISEANIIAANVIDRAVFLVFLGILFLLTFVFHAQYRAVVRRTAKKKLSTEMET